MSEKDLVLELRRLGSGCLGTISSHHCPTINDAAGEIERLRSELADMAHDLFVGSASYDSAYDRWCTDGMSTAVAAGDKLVEIGGWQHLDIGYGRVQFYRENRLPTPGV